MQVSVESLEGLKRRIHVSIPNTRLERAVEERLRQLIHTVKLDGFRPGKAPLDMVRKRYEKSVRYEVAQHLLEETLPEAISSEKLAPVSSPSVDTLEVKPHEDFRYAVSFEVYPEFQIKALTKKQSIEWIVAEISQKEVEEMLEKLRAQHKTWEKVERAAKTGDQVLIDFKGFVDEEAIEQGEAKDFTLELGSGQLIPGFEKAIMDHQAGEQFEISVTFPKDYQEAKLSGKKATFNIVLHEVREGKLPEWDEALIKKFGITSGKFDDLKKDIQQNMERELEKHLREIHREVCFDAFRELNPFELPEGLVKKELAALKHDMYHRITGHEHAANEKIPDFPDELFIDQAKRRVHLGLLCSEYVKQQNFVAKAEEVEKVIDRYATAYASPEAFKEKCKQDAKWLAEIEGVVVEQMIVDTIKDQATLKEKKLDYEAVMNYKSEKPSSKSKE